MAAPSCGIRSLIFFTRGTAMNDLPISDYALLSDCRSAALVSRAGSVDWLCFPRFDGPAVFSRILDSGGGHFAIRPAGDFEVSRAYAGQAMVLETTYRAASGTCVLTDAMAVGDGDRGHDLGAGSPGVLLRSLACADGEMDIEVSYAPRPEYGLVHPILEAVPGGLAARGGAGRLLLSASADFRVDGATATARLHLVAHPPDLRGPVARPGPPLRPGAAGAHLPADRRHRGRAHHLAAGDHRRRAQLGLPLHLGPRCQLDHGGTVGGGLPG